LAFLIIFIWKRKRGKPREGGSEDNLDQVNDREVDE
jgi:hypothetical protein